MFSGRSGDGGSGWQVNDSWQGQVWQDDDGWQAGKEEAGAIAKADGAAEVASFLAKAGLTQHFVTFTLRNNDVLTMKNLESMRKPDVKKRGLNIGEAATLMKRLANHKAQV